MYSEKFIYFQKFREMFRGVAVITLSQVPQQSLNSGSSQMQIMLTACWRFVMMKTFSFTAQNNSSLKKKSADENFKDGYVIASTISHNVGTAYGDLQEIVEHIFTKLT